MLRKKTAWEEIGVTLSVKQRPENRAVRRYGHTTERENVPPPKKKKNVASLNGRRKRKSGRSKYKNNSKTHCTSIMEDGSLESEKWDNRLP